jgi:hypothetical protein
VNYLSGRPSPSRFSIAEPLNDPVDNEFRRRYRREFLERLEARPPRYVLALGERECAGLPNVAERRLQGAVDGLMSCLGELPALHAFVAKRYAVAQRFGPLELWSRLPEAEGD